MWQMQRWEKGKECWWTACHLSDFTNHWPSLLCSDPTSIDHRLTAPVCGSKTSDFRQEDDLALAYAAIPTSPVWIWGGGYGPVTKSALPQVTKPIMCAVCFFCRRLCATIGVTIVTVTPCWMFSIVTNWFRYSSAPLVWPVEKSFVWSGRRCLLLNLYYRSCDVCMTTADVA